jgi:hypothetical protein
MLSCIYLFQALMMIHRFFSISLLAFFVLWYTSTPGQSGPTSQVIDVDESLLFISINSTTFPCNLWKTNCPGIVLSFTSPLPMCFNFSFIPILSKKGRPGAVVRAISLSHQVAVQSILSAFAGESLSRFISCADPTHVGPPALGLPLNLSNNS